MTFLQFDIFDYSIGGCFLLKSLKGFCHRKMFFEILFLFTSKLNWYISKIIKMLFLSPIYAAIQNWGVQFWHFKPNSIVRNLIRSCLHWKRINKKIKVKWFFKKCIVLLTRLVYLDVSKTKKIKIKKEVKHTLLFSRKWLSTSLFA